MSAFGETINIGHLEVNSPWGNAGGVVESINDVDKLARTGQGWIETTSTTLEKRIGNSPNGEVVYVHIEETGESFNSRGMPNPGIDEVEKDIPEMAETARKLGKQLIVNVAPVSDNPAEESAELVERAYEAGAHAVLLNGGCPNVVTEDGGRHEILSTNPSALYSTLVALRKVVLRFPPVFIRVSPVASQEEADEVKKAMLAAGTVSTIFTPNTWPGRKPPEGYQQLEVPGGVGGLSGPATADESAEQTAWFASGGDFDVVSSSGIMNGRELARRLELGPNVKGGAGTTFYYQAKEDYSVAVDRLIWELLD